MPCSESPRSTHPALFGDEGKMCQRGEVKADESTVRGSGEFNMRKETVSAASTSRDQRFQPRNPRDIGFDRWGN